MDKTTKQLLYLLSAAMGTNEDTIDLQDADWDKLFSLAGSHNILPMIYESAQNTDSFCQGKPELANLWRNLAIKISVNQMYRTMEFLMIYDKLNKAGITALVVKGIVCRQLYPNPYYRSSGDEDVYISKKDFRQVDSIFQDSGLQKDKLKNKDLSPDQVTTYHSLHYGLSIELHVDLFSPDSELFGPMNSLFQNTFENMETVEADGITIHTLSSNLNLLFLILHCTKHFLVTGFGIRQVCDLVMFINTYGGKVDWNLLWQQVTGLGYQVFLLNLLDIGSRYLGLKQDSIRYPEDWSKEDIHSEDLLTDIMDAGIFGKSTPEQIKTSSMTLNAVTHSHKHLVFKSLFPGLEYMGRNYPYCSRHPLLLPAAWIHRFVRYALEGMSPRKLFHKAGKSFAIGRKRIELLKEYKMIEWHNDMPGNKKRAVKIE